MDNDDAVYPFIHDLSRLKEKLGLSSSDLTFAVLGLAIFTYRVINYAVLVASKDDNFIFLN